MKLIYVDIETLAFQENVAIKGIGAICKKDNRFRTFYKTMLDTDRVDLRLLHKFCKRPYNIVTRSTKEMLISFKTFIKYSRDFVDEEVVLVAHNAHNFDARVLLVNFVAFGIRIPRYLRSHLHVYDSIDLINQLREKYKDSPIVPPNNKLDSCLRKFFNKRQKSHDGLSDSDLLRQVVERASKMMGYGSMKKFLELNEDHWRPFQHTTGKLHMIALVRRRIHMRDPNFIKRDVPKIYNHMNIDGVLYKPIILYHESIHQDLNDDQLLENIPVVKIVI